MEIKRRVELPSTLGTSRAWWRSSRNAGRFCEATSGAPNAQLLVAAGEGVAGAVAEAEAAPGKGRKRQSAADAAEPVGVAVAGGAAEVGRAKRQGQLAGKRCSATSGQHSFASLLPLQLICYAQLGSLWSGRQACGWENQSDGQPAPVPRIH